MYSLMSNPRPPSKMMRKSTESHEGKSFFLFLLFFPDSEPEVNNLPGPPFDPWYPHDGQPSANCLAVPVKEHRGHRTE